MVCCFDRADDGRISDGRKQRYQLDAEYTSADVRSRSLVRCPSHAPRLLTLVALLQRACSTPSCGFDSIPQESSETLKKRVVVVEMPV